MNVTMRVMDTSGRQTGTSEDRFPPAAWGRLGVLLRERRGQLDSRYRHRNVFAADVGLKESLLADLENAKRTSFTLETLAAVETAYQWTPGSIQRVLAGGDPNITHYGSARLSVSSSSTASAEVIPAQPEDLPEDVDWAGLTELERYLWLAPGAPVHLRQAWINMMEIIARATEGARPGHSGQHRRSV